MKTSNAVLLTIFGVLAAVIIIGIVGFRIGISRAGWDRESGGYDRAVEKPGSQTDKMYALKDFDSIALRGPWTVTVRRSDEYSVRAEYPKNYEDKISFAVQRDTLNVEVSPITFSGMNRLKLEITMPSLEEVRVRGAVDFLFSGFEAEELFISIDGAGDVTGKANTVENLTLRADGAVNVDMKQSPVTNADVEINGAGDIDLTMAGGVLSGSIEGVGSVTYEGKIREQRIELQGLGSVKRR